MEALVAWLRQVDCGGLELASAASLQYRGIFARQVECLPHSLALTYRQGRTSISCVQSLVGLRRYDSKKARTSPRADRSRRNALSIEFAGKTGLT